MEDHISNLEELYDRTRKCEGITIPKKVLILINNVEKTDSIRSLTNNNSENEVADQISRNMMILMEELMVAGVEEISIATTGNFEFTRSDSENYFITMLACRIRAFRDSTRPNCRILISPRVTMHLGNFDAAIVVGFADDNEPRTILNRDNIISNFDADKTLFIWMRVHSDDSRDMVTFSRNFAAIHKGTRLMSSSYTLRDDNLTYSDRNSNWYGFGNYRIVTEMVYTLCSDALSEIFAPSEEFRYVDCDAFASDAALFHDILGKFSKQGLFNEADVPKLDATLIKRLMSLRFIVGAKEENQDFDYMRINLSESEEVTMFSRNDWRYRSSEWQQSEYNTLVRQEDRLAGIAVPLVDNDSEDEEDPEEVPEEGEDD